MLDGYLYLQRLTLASQVHQSALDKWIVTQRQSVGDVLPGELRCADVIGGRGSFLTMAVVTESNPFIAVLLEIRGHPNGADQLETPSFSVRSFGEHRESHEQPLCVRIERWRYWLWCGHRSIIPSATCSSVLHHWAMDWSFYREVPIGLASRSTRPSHTIPLAIQVDNASVNDCACNSVAVIVEAKRLILNLDSIDSANVEKISMVLSTDNTCVGLWVPGTALSLISLHSMSITDRLDRGNASSCLAGVFSPNGVCFAGVFQAEGRLSLEIWSLPEASIGSNGVFENLKSFCLWDCMRAVWALLTHADPWDISQRIQRHAQALPESLAYFSLFYLDGMLHRHPHFSRPQYADLLDRIKIRVFLESRDPTIRVERPYW